nr:MAG TPA: hypothetical protein [Caudoviricetes sp.]
MKKTINCVDTNFQIIRIFRWHDIAYAKPEFP